MSDDREIDIFVGKKLREIRKKHLMTQAQIAEILDVSHQQVQIYEAGKSKMSAASLYKLSVVFDVTPSYFYHGLELSKDQKNSIKSDVIRSNRIKPLNMLIIEDSIGDQVLLKEAIEASDINVITKILNDGDSAIKYLSDCKEDKQRNQKPDIILLDLNLPKINGLEVLQFIKNDPFLKGIQVLIMTSSINTNDLEKTYDNFSSSYFKKPDSSEELNNTVNQIISYWNLVNLPSMQY